jgi:branched-subunit amino acid transport protein
VTPVVVLTFAVAGVVTFAWRFSFLAGEGAHERLSPVLRRALRYVPPAVLAALAAPAFLRHTGQVRLFDPWVLAALVGGLVAWRTRSTLATILAGMVVIVAGDLLGG